VNIIGPDSLIFGVEDLDGAMRYLSDYGLRRIESAPSGATFEAQDGTSAVVRLASDKGLASPMAPSPNLREAVYGVADRAALERIGAELGRDREVRQGSDGVLHSTDADGYPIAFQVTIRRALAVPQDAGNYPGCAPGRALNLVAAVDDAIIRPSTLSHFVLFTHDAAQAEKFYQERLGFRTVDYFIGLGPFMRPAGTFEHHTLFLVQVPAHAPLGVQHFTFHLSSANALLKAGWEFCRKGYKSFWGPGRHILGSNFFWYFNSPFGGLMEFDADMDRHDDNWVPRHMPCNADTSQTFCFEARPKFHPGA